MLLKGKNVIITGCARGIGQSMLELFTANGANVWACARKPTNEFEKRVENLAQEFGVKVTPIYFDFQNEQEMKASVKTIMSAKEKVDILINNAGITYNALFQMTTMEELRKVFEVNFFSQVMFTQYIVKLMIRSGAGSIVNIASSAALDGNSGRSAYGASKASMICVTKALAEELAEYKIRVNAIAPGITKTEMVDASMTAQVIQQTIQNTSLKRIGKPSEIASVALFLASDMASYLTGQVIRVDGGM